MRKLLAIAIALMMLVSLASCGAGAGSASGSAAAPSESASTADSSPAAEGARGPIAKEDLKIGVIHHLDPSDQGYTYNQDLGFKYMLKELGLDESQYIPKFNTSDQDEAAIRSAMEELIASGCQVIFAMGFGYGTQCIEYANQYPDIEFLHATGAGANSMGIPNYHNFFAKIHQARYLAGIAAGMKAKEIDNPKMGYIAAFPFAEVISGYSSYYLGAQSVYPEAVMDVIYINSWGDAIKEAEVAQTLVDRGCGVISQHSDSVAPATVCEKAGVFHVGYNNDMVPAAPNASLLSPRINWGIYITQAVQHMIDGSEIPLDWGEGIVEGATDKGAAYLSPLNTAIAAEGTQEAIDKAIGEILASDMVFSGALKDNNGDPLELYNFAGENFFTFEDENSVFLESNVDSAPSFSPKEGTTLMGITIVQ